MTHPIISSPYFDLVCFTSYSSCGYRTLHIHHFHKQLNFTVEKSNRKLLDRLYSQNRTELQSLWTQLVSVPRSLQTFYNWSKKFPNLKNRRSETNQVKYFTVKIFVVSCDLPRCFFRTMSTLCRSRLNIFCSVFFLVLSGTSVHFNIFTCFISRP